VRARRLLMKRRRFCPSPVRFYRGGCRRYVRHVDTLCDGISANTSVGNFGFLRENGFYFRSLFGTTTYGQGTEYLAVRASASEGLLKSIGDPSRFHRFFLDTNVHRLWCSSAVRVRALSERLNSNS